MSKTIRERIGQGLDAEARYGDRHWGDRRPGGFLPFQFQIPLGGGAPGLAFPIGGYGSPFAFTLPLGGSPPAPVVAMPAMPVPVPVPVPTEPPVTVASADLPLYVPPIQAADEAAAEAVEAETEAVSLGERLLAAAEAAGGEAQGFLESLLGEGLGEALLDPSGRRIRAPSASTLFHSLLYPQWGRPHDLWRSYADRFRILARPGAPIGRIVPLPGDLFLRVALGQGWGLVAVVGSRGLHAHTRLAARGLRFEGFPRLQPGTYVHLVEPGPRFRGLASRFARRVSDAGGLVLPDTLLLRLRPLADAMEVSEAEPGVGSLAASPSAGALRAGDTVLPCARHRRSSTESTPT